MKKEKNRIQVNKKFKLAAILMIIHGGFMEAGTALLMLPLIAIVGMDASMKQYVFSIEMFQNNIETMMAMGAIFGVCRIVAAVGILKNRMWGFAFGVINCIVTMAVMIFMIPAGVMDGILACTALVLLLQGYFGKKSIS